MCNLNSPKVNYKVSPSRNKQLNKIQNKAVYRGGIIIIVSPLKIKKSNNNNNLILYYLCAESTAVRPITDSTV
jgi:hypothetical protein